MRDTSLVGLRPTFSHDAPAIARPQTWKAIIRHWRDHVIADAALMIKKIRCHDRAYQVAGLSWSRAAAAVAIETGDRIATAGLQFGTEDIVSPFTAPSVNREARVHRKAGVEPKARVGEGNFLKTYDHASSWRLSSRLRPSCSSCSAPCRAIKKQWTASPRCNSGVTSPAEFFSPENVQKIMLAASAMA